MAQPPRRKYPSRNKFTPWLTVMMRRTESFNDPSGSTTSSASTTATFVPDYNTYLYDMYLDNVLYLSHFEDTSDSYSVIQSGGNTHFNNEVYLDGVSLTYLNMATIHNGVDAASCRIRRKIDSSQSKFGSTSLYTQTSGTADLGYSDLWISNNSNFNNIQNEIDYTTAYPFTLEFWFKMRPEQLYGATMLISYSAWLQYNGVYPCWNVWLYALSGTATTRDMIGLRAMKDTNVANMTATDVSVICDFASWHHIVVQKNGASSYSIYFDGKRKIDSFVMPATMQSTGGANLLYIGGRHATDWLPGYQYHIFNGWIDEFRYTSNVARYVSASFTLATAAFKYKPWHSGFINHLCNYTLDLGTYNLYDSLDHSFNRYGSPGGSPPRADFNTNSMEFDGTADAIEWSATASSDFDFSLGDMTVDIVFVPDGAGGTEPTPVLLQIGTDSATESLRICLDGNTPANVKLQRVTGGNYVDILSATTSISSSARSLISVARRDHVWTLFKDGIALASATSTFSVSGNIWIGNGSGLANSFKGWMNMTRTIKNGCQYIENFRPANKSFTYRNWSLE